jgi:hypothetical protein
MGARHGPPLLSWIFDGPGQIAESRGHTGEKSEKSKKSRSLSFLALTLSAFRLGAGSVPGARILYCTSELPFYYFSSNIDSFLLEIII